MSVTVNLSDDLAAQIDGVAEDRTSFVAEAVRRMLREVPHEPAQDEIARINELADELNQEAPEVLEYQAVS
jgi:predicted transcriptional regulator